MASVEARCTQCAVQAIRSKRVSHVVAIAWVGRSITYWQSFYSHRSQRSGSIGAHRPCGGERGSTWGGSSSRDRGHWQPGLRGNASACGTLSKGAQ